MNIELKNNQITISFHFDREIVSKVKSLGMKWRPKLKEWYIKDTLVNRNSLNKLFDLKLETYRPGDDSKWYVPSKYLMQHQVKALDIAKEQDRYAFFYDTGTGKTCLSIEIIKMRQVKTLVICPLSIIEPAWMEDLGKFAPELKAINLWKSCRKSTLNIVREIEQNDICIVNFESFKKLAPYLQGRFTQVFIDESSKTKNYKSQISKAITSFCENVQYVYLLSGTPAPNNKMEYFSQIKILDPTIFGTSFYKFRDEYFEAHGFGGFQYKERDNKMTEFLEKLSSVSTALKKEDVLDLPEKTVSRRDVILSPQERKAYNDMLKHMILEIDNDQIPANNAAVKLMKLRQVTSGFIINEDQENVTIGNSKLNALLELLEEIGDHQVIIWTQFHFEAKEIASKLPDSAICNGTVPQHKKEANIKDFKAGKIKYIIAHPRTLGHGVTLVNCSYAVYYSLSYSHEEHYQSRDRIYRKGQENHCTYYYLSVPNSIDEAIIKVLDKKEQDEAEILNFIKNHRRI